MFAGTVSWVTRFVKSIKPPAPKPERARKKINCSKLFEKPHPADPTKNRMVMVTKTGLRPNISDNLEADDVHGLRKHVCNVGIMQLLTYLWVMLPMSTEKKRYGPR